MKTDSDWVTVAKAGDLAPGGMKAVEAGYSVTRIDVDRERGNPRFDLRKLGLALLFGRHKLR